MLAFDEIQPQPKTLRTRRSQLVGKDPFKKRQISFAHTWEVGHRDVSDVRLGVYVRYFDARGTRAPRWLIRAGGGLKAI